MSAVKRIAVLKVGCLLAVGCGSIEAESLSSSKTNQPLEIRSLSVNGQSVAVRAATKLQLGSTPRNIAFSFGSATNTERAPLRIRYKLDGFDEDWREIPGDMAVSVRYVDARLDQVGESVFRVVGQTAGWTGELESSAFVHRHETTLVPPGATAFWIVMSSAGPPNSVGIYAITNFVVTRVPAGG